MKKLKILVLMGVLMAMCLGLTSCMLPGDLVEGVDPVASFDTTIDNLTVSFDGSNSVGDGVLSYDWYFGDGAESGRKNPSHVYGDYGTYLVLLIVTDENGITGRSEREITIAGSSDPVVMFSYLPSRIQTDSVVLFNGSGSYVIGAGIVKCRWDFGDGEWQQGSWDKTNTAWHTYDKVGAYTVILTVWDDNDKVKSAWLDIRVR